MSDETKVGKALRFLWMRLGAGVYPAPVLVADVAGAAGISLDQTVTALSAMEARGEVRRSYPPEPGPTFILPPTDFPAEAPDVPPSLPPYVRDVLEAERRRLLGMVKRNAARVEDAKRELETELETARARQADVALALRDLDSVLGPLSEET